MSIFKEDEQYRHGPANVTIVSDKWGEDFRQDVHHDLFTEHCDMSGNPTHYTDLDGNTYDIDGHKIYD